MIKIMLKKTHNCLIQDLTNLVNKCNDMQLVNKGLQREIIRLNEEGLFRDENGKFRKRKN